MAKNPLSHQNHIQTRTLLIIIWHLWYFFWIPFLVAVNNVSRFQEWIPSDFYRLELWNFEIYFQFISHLHKYVIGFPSPNIFKMFITPKQSTSLCHSGIIIWEWLAGLATLFRVSGFLEWGVTEHWKCIMEGFWYGLAKRFAKIKTLQGSNIMKTDRFPKFIFFDNFQAYFLHSLKYWYETWRFIMIQNIIVMTCYSLRFSFTNIEIRSKIKT